jgi:hypothetical protein
MQTASDQFIKAVGRWCLLTRGRTELLFFFCSVGHTVKFFCTDRSNTVCGLSDYFDLNTPDGRFKYIVCMVKIYRLIRGNLANHGPYDFPRLFETLERPSNAPTTSTITFQAHGVVRRFFHTHPHGEQLKAIHTALHGVRNGHLVQVAIVRDTRRSLHVEYTPLCWPSHPIGSTTPERLAWLTHVLLGLHALHQLGWAHNDVRLSNVLFNPDGDVWVVNDLDHCDIFGKPLPETHPLSGKNVMCSEFSDLYMVGSIVQTWAADNEQLGEIAIQLKDETQAVTCSERWRTQ